MKRKRHYSPKPKKTELERKLQSLKDQTDDRLCNLADQVYELENRAFAQTVLLGVLGGVVVILLIWQILTHFTV